MYKRAVAPRSEPLPRYHTVISVGDLEGILHHKPSPPSTNHSNDQSEDESASVGSSGNASILSLKPSQPSLSNTRLRELLIGATGIYSAYLYYGLVQEDLFRWRNDAGQAFACVWFLQVLESAVTMFIGYLGRSRTANLPLLPFFKSGASQLIAKVFMSASLSAGLSFPVVTLAKSGKIVPVMLGQLFLGGSTYVLRDYLFAVLLVTGTALVSISHSQSTNTVGNDTLTGLCLIAASLFADGFTGGLQKRLQRQTASLNPNNFDYLLYSHVSQFVIAICLCCVTGEILDAPAFIGQNLDISWYIVASCVCSCVGQCFVFYVIQKFDPLVCTTITTTRKMITIVLSYLFKGHRLDGYGGLGLCLAGLALFLEVEGKFTKFRQSKKNLSASSH